VQYNQVLIQAFIIDEAIRAVKEDRSQLVKTIGMLALLWATWNLEFDDKFRQTEVLLIMSALILALLAHSPQQLCTERRVLRQY